MYAQHAQAHVHVLTDIHGTHGYASGAGHQPRAQRRGTRARPRIQARAATSGRYPLLTENRYMHTHNIHTHVLSEMRTAHVHARRMCMRIWRHPPATCATSQHRHDRAYKRGPGVHICQTGRGTHTHTGRGPRGASRRSERGQAQASGAARRRCPASPARPPRRTAGTQGSAEHLPEPQP